MKKLFKFAALAALVLPLMVACKPKNNPDDPDSYKQPNEEFQDWIEEGSQNEIPVSEKNLCGIWKLCQTYTADADLNYQDGQNVDDPNNMHCLEIKEDNTFIDYFYNSELGTSKSYGIWDLAGKQFSFEYTVYPESGSLRGLQKGKFMVFRCEPEELALSYSETIQRIWNNGKDSTGTITYFSIFKRLYELPQLPKTLAEVIAANQWKVLSDTMSLGKYVFVENESTNFAGDVYQPVKVEQTNMIPANAVITFAPDSTLEIKDANGDMIAKAMWEPRGYWWVTEFPGANIRTLSIRINEENEVPLESQIIPGMPNNLEFYIDPSNDKRAALYEVESLSESEQKDGLTVRNWIYHLEMAK